MLDLIAALLVVFLALRGKRTGFIKTVLGMFSVIVCAILTVVVFGYISDAGVAVEPVAVDTNMPSALNVST